jgi:hypothetical protein
MNLTADSDSDDPSEDGNRLRFELIFASLWLAFGLFLLPALIFSVGGLLLGPYGENAGLSTFYIDFFGDLADLSGRAWSIALGPLLLISLLRAVFIGVRPKSAVSSVEDGRDDEPTPVTARRAPPPPARKPVKRAARPSRVEPRMGAD